jgi:hypothetical protein
MSRTKWNDVSGNLSGPAPAVFTGDFEKLGEAMDAPTKGRIRMFGPRGNPQARKLFGIVGYLQNRQGQNCTLRCSLADTALSGPSRQLTLPESPRSPRTITSRRAR